VVLERKPTKDGLTKVRNIATSSISGEKTSSSFTYYTFQSSVILIYLNTRYLRVRLTTSPSSVS
jgi:hypothetical protein